MRKRIVGVHDEELTAVRVRTRVGHRDGTAYIPLLCRRCIRVQLISERVARSAAARTGRITSLDHETGDDAMENDVVIEPLAGEGDEVLDRLRGIGIVGAECDVTEVGVECNEV